MYKQGKREKNKKKHVVGAKLSRPEPLGLGTPDITFVTPVIHQTPVLVDLIHKLESEPVGPT